MIEQTVSQSDARWLLSSACTLHQLPFDAELLEQRFPPPLPFASFEEAAAELGLQARQIRIGLEAALARHLPVMLEVEPSEGASKWLLVLNADEARLLVMEYGASSPTALDMTTARARYQGSALYLTPEAPPAQDPDNIDSRPGRFGLHWFVPELARHGKIWREVLLASLALQLMSLAMPLFTQTIIDKVVVHRTQSTLLTLAAAMALFMIFTGLLTWTRQYLILHTGQRLDAVLGSQVFDQLFRLPLAYFQNRPTGVISARLHGIETVREFLTSSAVTLALDLPFLLIFVGIMFFYSVGLTLLVLALLGLVVAMSIAVAPLFRAKLNEQFLRGAATQAFLTEYVAGIETIKSLQVEPQLSRSYRGLLADYLKAGFATRQLANTYSSWANTLEQLLTLLVLVVGAWVVMTSTSFTVGMLVAFQMFAARISQPMLRLVGLWQEWQQTRIALSRLGDIMNAPAESLSIVPRRAHSNTPSTIAVERLAFRYAEDRPFLYEDLSFSIGSGELVALMGPSGSGKSTLAKLLQGFYAPARGIIRVDGVDTSRLSPNELRSFFGVVPQETTLFSGTILHNLKLGNPNASFEQVIAACRMAEIHATIEALPQGYQTEIGERGVGLSGGQRQRLSIARALLKGPRVLIFDESTSSVDPLTAEQLGRTINALKSRVTILFIAHMLPKSLQADRVIRIGDKLTVVAAPERTEAGGPGHE